MKILVVFTGGTIGSSLKKNTSGLIGLDPDKPYRLLEAYRAKYGSDPEFDTTEPVTLLSENSTGSSISAIVNAVSTATAAKYDGIIVTHGTDTLQYTSAALGYCLGSDTAPVCVVSSDRPIEDPRANGLINLHAAVNFIRSGEGRGVWTVYKNTNEKEARIHRATRLLAHQTASADLYGIRDEYYGRMDENGSFIRSDVHTERADEILPFINAGTGSSGQAGTGRDRINLPDICRSILRMNVYPGMPSPAVPDDVKYIILESYHSGTICTASEEYRVFFNKMYARGIRVFLTGSPYGFISSEYESTSEYDGMHIIRATGIAPIALYMKLWIADSLGIDAAAIADRSLGCDLP